MSEQQYPASRETDAKVAEVLGYTVKHLAMINGGPKRWFVMGDIGIRGRCPHYTTAAPDDWIVVGEMVAWLRERGVCIGIDVHPCREAPREFVTYGLGEHDDLYSDYCASPGYTVAQVLLQVAEREHQIRLNARNRAIADAVDRGDWAGARRIVARPLKDDKGG